MTDRPNGSFESACFLDAINARLSEAAESGEPLGVMIAVRGRVFRAPGGRWYIRTSEGHRVGFRTEFVLAFNGTTQGSRNGVESPAPR